MSAPSLDLTNVHNLTIAEYGNLVKLTNSTSLPSLSTVRTMETNWNAGSTALDVWDRYANLVYVVNGEQLGVGSVSATGTYLTTFTSGVSTVNVGPSYLYSLTIDNSVAAKSYIQIFDALKADITLNSTVPKLSMPVAASGVQTYTFSPPVSFTTAINIASTSTATGSGAVVTTVNIQYGIL